MTTKVWFDNYYLAPSSSLDITSKMEHLSFVRFTASSLHFLFKILCCHAKSYQHDADNDYDANLLLNWTNRKYAKCANDVYTSNLTIFASPSIPFDYYLCKNRQESDMQQHTNRVTICYMGLSSLLIYYWLSKMDLLLPLTSIDGIFLNLIVCKE